MAWIRNTASTFSLSPKCWTIKNPKKFEIMFLSEELLLTLFTRAMMANIELSVITVVWILAAAGKNIAHSYSNDNNCVSFKKKKKTSWLVGIGLKNELLSVIVPPKSIGLFFCWTALLQDLLIWACQLHSEAEGGGARNAHKCSPFGESGRERGPYWSKNLDPDPQ
jgi:hypothetical protein